MSRKPFTPQLRRHGFPRTRGDEPPAPRGYPHTSPSCPAATQAPRSSPMTEGRPGQSPTLSTRAMTSRRMRWTCSPSTKEPLQTRTSYAPSWKRKTLNRTARSRSGTRSRTSQPESTTARSVSTATDPPRPSPPSSHPLSPYTARSTPQQCRSSPRDIPCYPTPPARRICGRARLAWETLPAWHS